MTMTGVSQQVSALIYTVIGAIISINGMRSLTYENISLPDQIVCIIIELHIFFQKNLIFHVRILKICIFNNNNNNEYD